MRIKPALIGILLTAFTSISFAQSLINEMQTCQALISFVEQKLASPPASYEQSQVNSILEGLRSYDNHIQTQIVSPGLLQFNQGDKAKADSMQKQVDDYKASLVNNFKARYPQNRLYTDFALSLNNCAKKAVPDGAELEQLKVALNAIVSLARTH